MTKILLLSDTHSHLDDKMLTYADWTDEIWHAGDIGKIEVADRLAALKPFRAVYGNIDGQDVRSVYPLHNRFDCEQVSVWMTHIGGYPGKYNLAVRDELYQNPPKLFICGHSHILKVQFDPKIKTLHMNPGAAGIYGFHQVRTMLRFEINIDKIEKLEVIEFSKKQ
jgi:putative phosphoesterase